MARRLRRPAFPDRFAPITRPREVRRPQETSAWPCPFAGLTRPFASAACLGQGDPHADLAHHAPGR
ncbi:Hypothetical protein A7982_02882 [Minicystis rosea]|nr:Hypothetical protein A7982_02882 [Minicystis rosea]